MNEELKIINHMIYDVFYELETVEEIKRLARTMIDLLELLERTRVWELLNDVK